MFDQCFRVHHRMLILFDALFITLSDVSENCLEAPGLKPFSTLCVKSKCPLFVQ